MTRDDRDLVAAGGAERHHQDPPPGAGTETVPVDAARHAPGTGETRMDALDPDQEATAAAAELLLTRHPAAQFDTYSRVTTAGFLCAPGWPGRRQVRIAHRTLFPDAVNGLTFADAAAEEHVLVAVYADLLRAHGWTVKEIMTTRPGLLASQPAPLPHHAG